MAVNARRRWRKVCGAGALLAALGATGCATNPVTGDAELALISEAREIAIGRQQYAPAQQMQGGAYVIDPALQAYVAGVGARLAAVSDRRLPYEFVVLNSDVPNAWALPGGKIAVNRGLLTELQSEAELAAVLGHEITHAAARHGAQAMERGMIVQGALLATALAVGESEYSDYAPLAIGTAALGAQLVKQKYGRDAERESDRYGMVYMQRAGYDPSAAVDLQQTFVRLSEGRATHWLDGLFASHPPSLERASNNRAFAAELGSAGDYGRARYQAAIATLKRRAPSYAALEEGRAALRNGDTRAALEAARRAIEIEPTEARFHALVGDAHNAIGQGRKALLAYDRAIDLEPGYFAHYQARGFALLSLDRLREAEQDFARANRLLPTAEGSNALGRIALSEQRRDDARRFFAAAAASNSNAGNAARLSLVRLDFDDRPGALIAATWRIDNNGGLILDLRNRTQIAAAGIVAEARVRQTDGRTARRQLPLKGTLGPGQSISMRTGLTVPAAAVREDVAVAVVSAQPAEG